MPTLLKAPRVSTGTVRRVLSTLAALGSVAFLATCDLDKITSAKPTTGSPSLSFTIAGADQVLLAGTTALSISPSLEKVVVRWSSSAPAIARVDSTTGVVTGVVTGVGIGVAQIVARVLAMELDTGYTQSKSISVRYKAIRIAPLAPIHGLGLTRAVTVGGTDAQDRLQPTPLSGGTLALTVRDSGSTSQTVASIAGGMVRALRSGVAYVKAVYDGNLSDSTKVVVRQVAKSIAFTDTVFTANALNFGRRIPIVVRDIADSLVPAPDARWRSSDTNKVVIDSVSGVLRVKVLDTARVMVRVDTVVRSIKVRVIQQVGSLAKTAGDAQTDTVTRLLPVAPQVTALDSGGVAVPNASVTFRAGVGTGATITDSVKTTDAAGKATLGSWRLGTVAGTQTVIATSGVISTTFSATARPARAFRLVFRTHPTSAAVGAAITPGVQVAIQDSLGNLITGSTDTVTIGLQNNPGGAILGGTLKVAAVGGLATFSNLTVSAPGSGYKLSASSGTLTPATSNTFNITPGAAAKLAFIQQPTNTVAGVSITPAVVVAVQDANSNTVTTDNTTQIAIAIGTNPGGGTLSGTTPVTVVNGVATFSNLSINRTGIGYTLSASSGTLTSATSNTFNIAAPGTATKLGFIQQPTNTVAGVSISPAVTVAVQDAGGNTITTDGTTQVMIAIATNAGGGTLSGTTPVTVVNGVATFSNLSINKTGTGYRLSASSGTLTSATSNTFNITPGTATKVAFVQQPTNTAVGASITPAVTVAVQDVNSNTVTTDNASQVSIAIGTNPGGGTLSGTTPVTVVNGVATFSNLSINRTGTGYTLSVSSGALINAVSRAFDVYSTASKLGFVTEPTNTVTGTVMAPIRVAVQDAGGVTVTTATQTITLSIANCATCPAAGTGTLTGTTSVAAVNGVATFDQVTMSGVANGYRLQAAATGLTAAQSASFNVTGTTGWQTLASMPLARTGLAVEVISGTLYAAGGHNVTDQSSLQSFTAGAWSTRAAMPAGRYQGNGAGVINGELYVAGGWTTSPGLPNSTLFIYNPGSNSWRSGTPMPMLSACGASGVINGRLYVMTPCDGNSGWRQFFHVFDPATNSWSALTQIPNVHVAPASGVIDGRFYVVGGHDSNGNAIATMQVYDPATNGWTIRASMSTARHSAASAVVNGKLYVIGGRAGSVDLNTVERYDPATNTWTTLTPMPTARHGAGAGVINGVIHVVGGQSGSTPLATVQAYTP